jgi:ABC-2 type transport system ATP-binding protein
MDEADRLAQRIAIIDYGKLLVLDSSDRLKTKIGRGDILEINITKGDRVSEFERELPGNLRKLDYRENKLRLVGEDISKYFPQLIERLNRYGLRFSDMIIRQKTLEDVFISLTGRRLRE